MAKRLDEDNDSIEGRELKKQIYSFVPSRERLTRWLFVVILDERDETTMGID